VDEFERPAFLFGAFEQQGNYAVVGANVILAPDFGRQRAAGRADARVDNDNMDSVFREIRGRAGNISAASRIFWAGSCGSGLKSGHPAQYSR
jgi:hypothetical protein